MSTGGTPIGGRLGEKVEAFCIDKEYIDIPYWVEYQVDLREVKA